MAILNVLKYDGPNDELVWKWHSESNDLRENELRMGSQLIVNQSQEACFYSGGQLLGCSWSRNPHFVDEKPTGSPQSLLVWFLEGIARFQLRSIS